MGRGDFLMSHWYSTSGEPTYTVVGKNGKERPTTLADARKLNLWPSVTTVMQVKSSPGLNVYFQNQLLEAAWNTRKGKSFEAWRGKVIPASKEHSKNASERGTEVHDSLEKYYLGQPIGSGNEALVEPVVKFLEERFPGVEWVAEASFTHPLGFGGKVDLHSPDHKIVLDFKTKNKPKEEIEKLRAYDEHHMQSAAYAEGLFPEAAHEVERYNLFVGYEVDDEGKLIFTGLKLTESTDFYREWGMFAALLDFWQFSNNYWPGRKE